MNKLKIEIMENTKLLKKIAQSFSITTGIEFDDLFQEAYLTYCKALESYDPSKSRLSTHAWNCISAHLKNYVKEEQKHTGIVSIESPEVINKPALSTSHFIESLSFGTQELLSIVFDRSDKYMFEDKQKVVKKLKHTMVRRGWADKKFDFCMKEIELVCN
jgi:RNA polymerase sigma factor (sigma-70 family)